MKNKLKLLLLPLIIFGLTACGNNNSEKTPTKNPTEKSGLQTAIENTNKAKSYHLDYKIDMGMASDGITMEVPITMGMDMDLNTQLVKANLTMSMLGMTITVNEYMDLKNNIMYIENLDEENSWTKQKTENLNMSNVIEEMKNEKYIDETDTEYHYQAIITPEEFQKNLEMLGSTGSTEGMALEKDVTVDIYVNKKDNYVSRMEADLKDALKAEDDIEYTKLKFVISISNINNVSVPSIDQSIIDNAVEAEE